MTNTTKEERLGQLVECYRVCWDVEPDYAATGGRVSQTGFELELIGTHARGVHDASPGCSHCREVLTALLEIAEWIIPRQPTASQYPITPHQRELRYDAARGNRPDVVLSIKVEHREGFGPVDDCERACLKEMEEKLSAIGVPHRCWSAWNGMHK